jgi:hypothetical protein
MYVWVKMGATLFFSFFAGCSVFVCTFFPGVIWMGFGRFLFRIVDGGDSAYVTSSYTYILCVILSLLLLLLWRFGGVGTLE